MIESDVEAVRAMYAICFGVPTGFGVAAAIALAIAFSWHWAYVVAAVVGVIGLAIFAAIWFFLRELARADEAIEREHDHW